MSSLEGMPWIVEGIDLSDAPLHVKVEALRAPKLAAERMRLRNEAIEQRRIRLRGDDVKAAYELGGVALRPIVAPEDENQV